MERNKGENWTINFHRAFPGLPHISVFTSHWLKPMATPTKEDDREIIYSSPAIITSIYGVDVWWMLSNLCHNHHLNETQRRQVYPSPPGDESQNLVDTVLCLPGLLPRRTFCLNCREHFRQKAFICQTLLRAFAPKEPRQPTHNDHWYRNIKGCPPSSNWGQLRRTMLAPHPSLELAKAMVELHGTVNFQARN